MYGYKFYGSFTHCTDEERVLFFFLIIGSMLFVFGKEKHKTDWMLFKQHIEFYFKNKKKPI